MNGNLYIVSAPSGAGKTSLVAALLDIDPRVRKSVSFTTRAPRTGEADGREYNFVSVARFEAMRARGDFVESALVHGNYYGTSHQWVGARLTEGQDILLEIDWQGAAQVRRVQPDAVGIFIVPPSYDALLSRLSNRGTDAPDIIARRLKNAREEIAHLVDFDYVIINDDFDRAAQELAAVVVAERLKRARQLMRNRGLIEPLLHPGGPPPSA
ncbi:MAG: guanylate kinase [Betaproteobacteria bacterium]|nr:guanylate kinase [Betaproteobacteria bacterium]